MRAGYRTERENQRHQHRAGRERVGKQRNRDVAAGQPLAHDAGANDRRQQQRRADRLGSDAPRPAHAQQPGAQQLAGFVARMNALMNLPSTCGAIASTSMPCPVRNVRASSML